MLYRAPPLLNLRIGTLPEVVYSCAGCFISRSYPSYADIICGIDLNQKFPNRKHKDLYLYLYLSVAPTTTINSQCIFPHNLLIQFNSVHNLSNFNHSLFAVSVYQHFSTTFKAQSVAPITCRNLIPMGSLENKNFLDISTYSNLKPPI